MTILNSAPTKPNIHVTLGPKAISSEDVTFTADGAMDLDADLLNYQWKIDDGTWGTLTPNGKYKVGEHIVYVRVNDNYGGVSQEALAKFTIVNSPPILPSIKVLPEGPLTTASDVLFAPGENLDPDGDVLTYEWSYDNGTWSIAPPNGKLALGAHTLALRATDSAGLISPVATYRFTVDKAPPTVPSLTISPTESIYDDTNVSFNAMSISPDNKTITYQWSVDGGPWLATKPDGMFTVGPHAVSVRAVDSDGTMSAVTSRSFTVIVKTVTTTLEQTFDGVTSPLLFSGNWTKSNLQSSQGTNSLKSGVIGNSQSSQSTLTFTVPTGATNASLSFDYLVRSEDNRDFFSFSLDGATQSFSGFGSWTTLNLPLTPGAHTFTVTYTKDATNNLFDDAAFIDHVSVTYTSQN
jgi:hypothetical protein